MCSNPIFSVYLGSKHAQVRQVTLFVTHTQHEEYAGWEASP